MNQFESMPIPGNTNMSGNEDSSSNATPTSDNGSSSISSLNQVKPHGLTAHVLNLIVPGISAVILFSEIFAVQILRRCRRIPYKCLRLSISYLLSDIIGTTFMILHQLLIAGLGVNTDLLHNSRLTTFGIMNNVSSALITAIVLDRVFALKAHLKYTLVLNKKINLVIASIWVVHVLIPLCVICASFYRNCNWKLFPCDLWEVNKAGKYLSGIIMIIYDVILIIANSFVYKIARRHAAQIDAMNCIIHRREVRDSENVSERQFASLQIIIKLVAANVLLKAPAIIVMLISSNVTSLRDETIMRVLRAFSYICIQINSFINLYLYIWKMKECKMIFYFILAKYFKRYERRAEMERLQVYDIVVISTCN